MENCLQAPSKPKLTFADKFSKFKSRFMLVFWLSFFAIAIHYSFNFLSSIYAISKTNTSFYSISISEKRPTYTRVEVMPDEWTPLNKISKRVQQAIISSEDGKFYDHPGYDVEQLQDAVHDTFILKKKMRGASTITQQLMKNLFLSRHKTYGRKLQELVMAVMVERYSNKAKILETYLNVIEYGEGLYGITAASKFYFKKSPAQLNAREAAFLAMLLPSPKKYSKSFKNKMLTQFADHSVASILHKMRMSGFISENEYLEQLNGRLSWERAPVITETKEEQVMEQEFFEENDDNTEI